MADLPRGGEQYRTANLQTDTSTRADAAKLLNVSERSVNTAKKVEGRGVPSLGAAVDAGGVYGKPSRISLLRASLNQ